MESARFRANRQKNWNWFWRFQLTTELNRLLKKKNKNKWRKEEEKQKRDKNNSLLRLSKSRRSSQFLCTFFSQHFIPSPQGGVIKCWEFTKKGYRCTNKKANVNYKTRPSNLCILVLWKFGIINLLSASTWPERSWETDIILKKRQTINEEPVEGIISHRSYNCSNKRANVNYFPVTFTFIIDWKISTFHPFLLLTINIKPFLYFS